MQGLKIAIWKMEIARYTKANEGAIHLPTSHIFNTFKGQVFQKLIQETELRNVNSFTRSKFYPKEKRVNRNNFDNFSEWK